MDAFQARTASGATVEEIVFPPLEAGGVELTVVDAGARNGMQLPAALARRAAYVGFEPNAEEYRKLVSHTTDAERVGMPVARFRSEEYHDCALWSREETRPFFITAGAGACTLMGRTRADLTQRMWLEGGDKPYGDVHTDVRTSVPIACRRLDQVLDPERSVDYLKLDAEGAELAILEGAQRLFEKRSVLFVKSEFFFTPYYEVHPLLGHQQVFLHERGFRLIDLDLDQPRYTRDRTRVAALADRRLIYAGDAYYVLDPDRQRLTPLELQRMAVVALAHGFRSLAVSLLRDAGLVEPRRIDELEAALSRPGWKTALRHAWGRVPHVVNRYIARLMG